MTSSYMLPFFTPEGLKLACPPAAQGQTTNAEGEYDPQSLANAAHVSGTVWGLSILLFVVLCYNATKLSLSPRFVIRWWIFLFSGAMAAAAALTASLSYSSTTALVNTCQSDPRAFEVPLPGSFVWAQSIGGFLYGLLLFVLLSIVFTVLFGRFPHMRNGFFHNRGCPIPRALP